MTKYLEELIEEVEKDLKETNNMSPSFSTGEEAVAYLQKFADGQKNSNS